MCLAICLHMNSKASHRECSNGLSTDEGMRSMSFTFRMVSFVCRN